MAVRQVINATRIGKANPAAAAAGAVA